MNLRTDVPHELPDTELKSKGRGAVKEALMQLRAEGYPVELPKEDGIVRIYAIWWYSFGCFT